MKKNRINIITLFFLSINILRAGEGMWLPFLLEKNIADMQAGGLKLSAEDIYSINKSSLKDAVVHFGGGCTAEVLSYDGLILTNHHCGYGQIQSHSSVQNDYLTNGFWAMRREDELPNNGLTATFIISMTDVTTDALKNYKGVMSEKSRDSLIVANSQSLIKGAVKGTHYDAYVRPFYNGNQYILIVTETFKDVRLVGAPPESVGNFGGDTDNWMWPRHTCDFSLFRIYAGKDNKPAAFSKDNVPFKPRKSFTINAKGVEKGDFTMVYGFPGRTTEYLSSYAVSLIMNTSNPIKINMRELKLSIIEKDMKSSDEIRIKYSAKFNGTANYYKKWMGESLGLKINKAVYNKEEFEKLFTQNLTTGPNIRNAYSGILPQLQTAYNELKPYQIAIDYFNEAIMGIELFSLTRAFDKLVDMCKNTAVTDEQINTERLKLIENVKGFYKDYNVATDKKIFETLFPFYIDSVAKGSSRQEEFKSIIVKYKSNYKPLANLLYSKSLFTSETKLLHFLNSFTRKQCTKILKDDAYHLSNRLFRTFNEDVLEFQKINSKITLLNRDYIKAQMDIFPDKKYYPDANSTLRVTYGKVDEIAPRDGLRYNYYTTLDGVMQKDGTAPDYVVPKKLKELWQKKDYGTYADKNGELRTCFIASNHTTGGNSGSPVLDANGNLVGINFDRIWEGTMSDIMYDPNRCRNITADIRYVLFVIDKLGGAGYLLNEMTILK